MTLVIEIERLVLNTAELRQLVCSLHELLVVNGVERSAHNHPETDQ